MNCSSCGMQIPAGATNCPKCGVAVPYYYSYSGTASSEPTIPAQPHAAPQQTPSTAYGSQPYGGALLWRASTPATLLSLPASTANSAGSAGPASSGETRGQPRWSYSGRGAARAGACGRGYLCCSIAFGSRQFIVHDLNYTHSCQRYHHACSDIADSESLYT